MTEKELRRLSRADLLEMLIDQSEQLQELKTKYEQAEQALQQRYAAHLQALASGDMPALALTSFNRFEEAVFALQPQTAQVFALLQSLQPDAVRMSGSGPTLVGYFASSERAAAAQRALQSRGLESVLCHPLA